MLNRPLVFLGHGENMVKTAAYASFKWSCFSPFYAKHHLANGMFLHLAFPFSQLEFHVVLKNDLGPKGAVKQGNSGLQEITKKHVKTFSLEQSFDGGSEMRPPALCEKVRPGAELVGDKLLVELERELFRFPQGYWCVTLAQCVYLLVRSGNASRISTT